MAALLFWGVVGCTHLVKNHRDKRLYKHSSVNPARRETRLLTLEPSTSFLAEIRGDVRTVSLDDPSLSTDSPYEALSYVWGSTASKADCIRIGTGGGGGGRRLWLPYNLGQALRYLRYKDRPRTLWVDYVSVRQDDAKEKASQVAMMADIFASASRVVVWLGPAANESNTAMALLDDLGWMVEFDFENTRMRPSAAGAASDPSWADPAEPLPYEHDELWAIYQLVHRSWFGRVWVRQEIAAADPDAAVVSCGNRTVPWQLFRAALACIANKPRRHLDLAEESSPELRFARRYELVLLLLSQPERQYGLADLLDQGRKFNCADPRDRVYAAVSMASDAEPASMGLAVDYSRSKMQVYRDAVLRYIECSKNTNILASCEMTSASASASTPIRRPQLPPTATATTDAKSKTRVDADNTDAASMPTWIPDWAVKRVANTMPMHHLASSLSEAHVRHNGSDVLRASCVRCATVKTADQLFGDFVPVTDVVAAVVRCAPKDVLTGSYRYGSGNGGRGSSSGGSGMSLLEAYCSTLAWGLFDSLYSPPLETYPDFDASVSCLKLLLEQDEQEERDQDHRDQDHSQGPSQDKTEAPKNPRPSSSYDHATLTFATHLLSTCKGRSFFTTEEGHVGLGPRHMRPGDRVFVVLGCDVPLVLRQRLDSKYEVVGDGYVQGLMTGEALLGPLPDEEGGWRMVLEQQGEDGLGSGLDEGEGEGTSASTSGLSVFVRFGGESGRDVVAKTAEDPRVEGLRARLGAAGRGQGQGTGTGGGDKGPPLAVEDLLTPKNLRAAGVEVLDVNLG